jgi:tellurite resistance protein
MPQREVMMSRQQGNRETHAKRAGIATAFREYREDELLDVLVSAAALLARADGWVQEVERIQLLDFLDREDFFSVFVREDVLTQFDRRISELSEPGGPSSVLCRLGRHRDGSTAALIVNVGEEIAAADCRLDPREQRVLELVRDFLENSVNNSSLQGVAPRAGSAQRMIGQPRVVPRRTSASDAKPRQVVLP